MSWDKMERNLTRLRRRARGIYFGTWEQVVEYMHQLETQNRVVNGEVLQISVDLNDNHYCVEWSKGEVRA